MCTIKLVKTKSCNHSNKKTGKKILSHHHKTYNLYHLPPLLVQCHQLQDVMDILSSPTPLQQFNHQIYLLELSLLTTLLNEQSSLVMMFLSFWFLP